MINKVFYSEFRERDIFIQQVSIFINMLFLHLISFIESYNKNIKLIDRILGHLAQ